MLTKDIRTSGTMRNKPCLCKSGRKYKLCCWPKFNVSDGLTVLGVKDMIKTLRYKMLKQFRDTGVLPGTDESRRLLTENMNGKLSPSLS